MKEKAEVFTLQTGNAGPIPVFHFQTLDSTNTRAKMIALPTDSPMAVVWADRQTAGRGQRSSVFFSERPAGLYISMCLSLRDIADHFTFNRAMACSVCDMIEEQTGGNSPVGLKWPNDIFWRSRKLGGILLETVGSPPDRLVIGVGLNISLRPQEFPHHLRATATSLFVETKRDYPVAELLEMLLRCFTRRIKQPSSIIHPVYMNRLLGIGRTARINGYRGVVDTVLPDGRLLLSCDKRTVVCTSGPLVFET